METVIRNFGHADVRFTWIRKSMLRKLCLGQNAEERALANLWQSYDSGLHVALFNSQLDCHPERSEVPGFVHQQK